MASNRREGEPKSADLGTQIRTVFDERFARLDALQNKKNRTVTEADLGFLGGTEKILRNLERIGLGALSDDDRSAFENMRTVLAAARGRVDEIMFVEDGGRQEYSNEPTDRSVSPESSPLFRQIRAVFDERFVRLDALQNAPETTEDDAHFFFDTRDIVSEILKKGLASLDETQSEVWQKFYAVFLAAQSRIEREWSEDEEADHVPTPEALEYKQGTGVTDYARRVESAGERIARMSGDIAQLHADITVLLDMPMGTTQEVAEAKRIFDIVLANAKDYVADWDKGMRPVLDRLHEAKQGWGRPLTTLVREHGEVMRRFFGRNARSEGEESIEGVLKTFSRRLRERRGEIWEQEFPDFSLEVAKMIINLQDARMRSGKDRNDAMLNISDHFDEIQKEWTLLRPGGPRISQEAWDKGERSQVYQYDVMFRALRRDIPALVRNANNVVRPAGLGDVSYVWREALVRTERFWNPGIEAGQKIAFLRKYGNGPVEESEMKKMIRSEEQAKFIEVAESDVLDALRERGAKKLEQRAQVERVERARLHHPALEMYRMEAKDLYRSAIRGNFWKDSTTREAREHMFAGDERISDDVLSELTRDSRECRRWLSIVNNAYTRAKNVEDQLYINGEPPEVKVKAKKIREVIDRYLRARETEVTAWKTAKYAEAWRNTPLQKREKILHYEFSRFWREGEAAFQDIPSELQGPIKSWVFARRKLRTIGEYTQWLLDEHPVFAQSIQNIPPEFVVPERESTDDSEGDVSAPTISAEDQRELALSVQDSRTGDDAGGGAFTDGEAGAAAETGSREGVVADDQIETGSTSGASEGEGNREAALAQSASRIVRTLSN